MMTTSQPITHALMMSLKRHIESIWGSDLYDYEGNQTRVAYCPDQLIPTLSYTDKDGVGRIFGPCRVSIGRVQEDVLNLANKLAVPSAYIEIVSNDYEEIESWRHSMYRSQDPSRKIGPEYPVMVGGEHAQSRRFVVKMITYFLESDQNNEETNRLGHAACSFLESICTAKWEMPNPWGWELDDEYGERVKDPFGEIPWASYAPVSHTRIRGGPPQDYIFDIKVYVEVTSYKEQQF